MSSNNQHPENRGGTESVQASDATNPAWWFAELWFGLGVTALGLARTRKWWFIGSVLGLAVCADAVRRRRRQSSWIGQAAVEQDRVQMPTTGTSETWDLVDEASWESFPSSDPPAFAR